MHILVYLHVQVGVINNYNCADIDGDFATVCKSPQPNYRVSWEAEQNVYKTIKPTYKHNPWHHTGISIQ